jgi:uncharacterized protein with FMN-binding domain
MKIKTTVKYSLITMLAFINLTVNAHSQDKTKDQADALIKQAGSTNPDWWNSVELKYPAALDMNWPIQQGVWDGRGGMGAGQVTELPGRQAGLAAVEALEKQVAALKAQIEKSPAVDPNIAGLQGAALTEFMNVYAPEIYIMNQIQQAFSSLTGNAISGTGNTSGLTTATLTELISLAKQDNAAKLTSRLEAIAKQIQSVTRGGPGGPAPQGQRGERGAGTVQIPANVEQYLMQIVYPNSAQHKQGIKLVTNFMSRHSTKFEKYRRDINILAYMYYDLAFDYARAAYWWQRYAQLGGSVDTLKIARCYYEIGSKSAAVEILSLAGTGNAPNTPNINNREVIKLWATIGEVDKALSMVESAAAAATGDNRGGQGGNTQLQNNMMLAGEICRETGRYDQAIAYYQKVIDAQPQPPTAAGAAAGAAAGRGGTADGRSLRARAAANIEALKLIKTLDLKKVPDGSYAGTGTGHEGTVTIRATIKGGKIESIEVTQKNETPNRYANAEKITRKIVSKQGFTGVDAVTGATETSDAIINAAAKAMAIAMK